MTLVELVVVLAMAALLVGLATPPVRDWIRTARVRAVAEGLLAGVRLAQGEAVRRDRQVMLARISSPQCGSATHVSDSSLHWVVRTVPAFAGDTGELVRCGARADTGTGVTVTGPAVLCFNAAGRLTRNADPGLSGASCEAKAARLEVRGAAGGTALAIDVLLSGGARLCDPARSIATAPHGCRDTAP